MDKQYRVLVADDSAFARKIVTTALANTEFKVVGEGKSDQEAIELFGTLKPDIVLLDVIMPEEGGTRVLKTIVPSNPGIKVIMLSSLGTEEAITECLSLGATTFIQKPFDGAALLAALRKLVVA